MLFQETSKHGTIQRIYLCEKCQKRLVAKEKKEMKMTDEQIETALNACTFGYLREKCRNCPLDSEKEPCMTNLHLAALEYMGRLKHRAEVAERALLIACDNMVKELWQDNKCEWRIRNYYDDMIQQAEKELAEEGKE